MTILCLSSTVDGEDGGGEREGEEVGGGEKPSSKRRQLEP